MSNIRQQYVEATKHVIINHGLQFFDNVDTPDDVIGEALSQLADEYDALVLEDE